MSSQKDSSELQDVIDGDEVREVLRDTFYRPAGEPTPRQETRPKAKRQASKPKADHYKVICISLYRDDLERLDAKVAELKRSGHPKMNRSALIRFALDQMDASKLPPSY